MGAGSRMTGIKLRTPDEIRERVLEKFLTHKRHSTAIALMWGIFTCGFVVINVIVFIQPQWIHRFERGSSSSLSYPGYIGLYERCEFHERGLQLQCAGKFYNFATISHPAMRAATFFVGVSCLIIWICIALFFFFFILKPRTVFLICGSLQLVSAVFMALGCLIFPAGWNHPDVMDICGSQSDQYAMADCKVGWAYILAMVGTFDIFFLAFLAFVLAERQLELSDVPTRPPSYSTVSTRIGTNPRQRHDLSQDDADSVRPTTFITPGLTLPIDHHPADQDQLSEFSQSTKKSLTSDFAL